MSPIAIIDPFSGIAGDMMLGALLEVGLDAEWLRALPARLALDGVEVRIQRVLRAGIACTKVDFDIPPQPHGRHIKKIREIDRSRVINTAEMAPTYAPRRSDEGIRVCSDKTLVVFVTHEYRVIESPGLVSAAAYDVAPAPRYSSYRPHRTACQYGRGRYGHCRAPLRVRD